MLDSVNIMFWERIHPKENLGVKKANSYPTRCDICGDSIKSKNKKRLSLYRKDNYDSDSIKCFNCGYTGTMKSYIRDYHPEFLSEYLSYTSSKALKELEIESILKTIPKKTETFALDLPKAIVNSQAVEYIRKRGGNPNDFFFSENGFDIDEKHFELKNYIIYPNIVDNKIISFYSRCLDSKSFYGYAPTADTKSIGITNADPNRYIMVFEGLFDMLCVPYNNKIAILGSNNKSLSKFQKILFCLDNDKTGLNTMLDYTKYNYKFCIWCDDPEYSHFKDINEVYQSGVNIMEFIKNHTVDNITAECKIKFSL